MKEIHLGYVTDIVAKLCREANYLLGEDVIEALRRAQDMEESPLGQHLCGQLLENAEIARRDKLPLCQDCGVAVVFVDIGQDVHLVGGDLSSAITEGVRKGYDEGYLRKSMVNQPFSERINTKDNTPPIIHTRIVFGDTLKIIVAPKGGGSENVSRFTVLKPAQGRQGVIDFVTRTVDEAGGDPCPPGVIGVGIGGTAEKAMELAKRSLLRKVGEPNSDPETANLEADILRGVNSLGIGPLGFGGRITTLAVHIETFPAHIASLPVAVNVQCHCARHKEAVLQGSNRESLTG